MASGLPSLDVTDTARDAEVVGETVERHSRLDVLVNNAGRTQVGAPGRNDRRRDAIAVFALEGLAQTLSQEVPAFTS